MSHEQSGSSKKEEHAPSGTNKEAGFSVPVDVQRIEVRLLKLLDEFNSGNILSFGSSTISSLLSEDGWKTTKTNVDALITRLDALSAAMATYSHLSF
ncbi:hypothetical protein FGIG_06083 [Fasciola gigantica]|uniref:Uncharacterized protein n=1 Tax=Fasciola gigantica TaxID=46835 RepID=A0A504Z228_FASGI|nr:hypothetical protein FGIG_06083 [Fasciola gigantica]